MLNRWTQNAQAPGKKEAFLCRLLGFWFTESPPDFGGALLSVGSREGRHSAFSHTFLQLLCTASPTGLHR